MTVPAPASAPAPAPAQAPVQAPAQAPNPSVLDPALYTQQDRPADQDIASRLHDQFFARPTATYYPAYHPQDHSHPTADNTEAALQAIATAAQHDRRASSASSASAGGAVKLDADAHGGQTKLGPDGKRLRACDHCRALKVRCDPQEENGIISEIYPCRRCLKSKKTCVTTAPAKKRTKKADTRVAELEKKVNELTARLGDAPMPPFAAAAVPPEGHYPVEYLESPARPEKRRRISEYTDASTAHELRKELLAHEADTRTPQSDLSHICYDIDRCLSPDVVDRILHRYVHVMAPAFPAVPLPLDTTASKLREEKPLLLLSIMNSASYGIEPLVPAETQRHLAELLQSWLAELVWRRQDKSLEIVQALQVCVLWYRPPAVFDRHAFYMMSNAATTMVLELGLGKRAGNAQAKLGLASFRRALPNAGGPEARRAYAMCYFIGTNISMILRRPIMLRWNQYMDECIAELESSQDALPSDKILCHRLKLAAIAEDVASQFSMDDPPESLNLSDKFNENALRGYEARLERLRQQRPVHADPAAIKYYEHVISLYMHNIAMLNNQNVDETADEGRPTASDPARVKCLQECISACHGILDNFMSLGFDEFYILPLMHSVRSLYALVCLAKMWIEVTARGSELGGVITPASLRLEDYFGQLMRRFTATEERDPQGPHVKFPRILKGMQARFRHFKAEHRPETVTAATAPGGVTGSATDTMSKAAGSNFHDSTRLDGAGNFHHSNHPGGVGPQGPAAQTQTPLHLLSEVAQHAQAPPAVQQHHQPQTQQQGTGAYTYDAAAAAAAAAAAQQHQQQHQPLGMGYNWDMTLSEFDISGMALGVDWSGLFGGWPFGSGLGTDLVGFGPVPTAGNVGGPAAPPPAPAPAPEQHPLPPQPSHHHPSGPRPSHAGAGSSLGDAQAHHSHRPHHPHAHHQHQHQY